VVSTTYVLIAVFLQYRCSAVIPVIEEQQQEQNNKEQNSAIVCKEITASSF
jgi:hypothetical protein